MSDLLSALAAGYKSIPLPSPGNYVRVDPTLYEGTWNGTYDAGTKSTLPQDFSFKITNVQGFRAQVQFKAGNGPLQSQSVLIKNSSFKIGNTKFSLSTKKGQAAINTIISDPVTGEAKTLVKATATRDNGQSGAPVSDIQHTLALLDGNAVDVTA
jgi:hypothetical protein